MPGAGDIPISGVPGVSGRHHSPDYLRSVGSRLRPAFQVPRVVSCTQHRTRRQGLLGVSDGFEYPPEYRPTGWT